jgi:hypothetical protein
MKSPLLPFACRLRRGALILISLAAASAAATAAPIWTDYSGAADGWKESPWFGGFSSASPEAGWAWSEDHGHLWLAGPSEDSLWLWSEDTGWLWTSRGVYPFMWDDTELSWRYYARHTHAPRWLYHYKRAEWAPAGAGVAAPATTWPETASATTSATLPSGVGLGDGTWVEMPATGASLSITLSRESHATGFSAPGISTSGSARTLRIDNDGGADADSVTPLIVFPRGERGSLVPETVNVLRIEQVPDGDGGWREERAILPVQFRADGSFAVRDFLMPESVGMAREAAAAATERYSPAAPAAREDVRDPDAGKARVRYIPCTFNGSLNYKRAPQLLRVAPTSTPPYRKPYSQLNADEKAAADAVFPHNIVVLVHGHNEEEKGGIYETTAPWPWYFAYKRDVWTQFFRYLPGNYFSTATGPDVYLSTEYTTRFYEFIYPSYRGVFNYLDEQLATQLEAALEPQLDAELPVNVVIIAHSMGGLVSRAGIQRFSDRLDDRFKELITWGTPHMGSPLVTLRYVLAAEPAYDFFFETPPEAILAGISGQPNWNTGIAGSALKYLIRKGISLVQMDAPGTRDLRYVRRPKQEETFRLGLERLFRLSAAQSTPENAQKFDLQDGSAIYNYNLQILNQSDRHAGSNRYFPIVGRTDRRLGLQPGDYWPWIVTDIEVENIEYETAKGATIMPLLVADRDEAVMVPTRTESLGAAAESDGAVNIPSMAAYGVSHYVGTAYGWDHEEYYGAPLYADGATEPELQAATKGKNLATFTLARMQGGSTAREHDRFGLMRTPRLGYRLLPGRNTSGEDGVTTNDVAYTRRFEIFANLHFNALDEFHESPFDRVVPGGIRLVNDPERSPGAPIRIPLTDVEIAPAEMPPVSQTSGSFISTSELVPDNPRLLRASVNLGSQPVDDRVLRLQLEFADGSTLTLPPSLAILSRPVAGGWSIGMSMSNGLWDDQRFDGEFEQVGLLLGADGSGRIAHSHTEVEDKNWQPETRGGTWSTTTWEWEGTASLVDNQLQISVILTRERTYKYFDQLYEDEKWINTEVTVETYSVMAADYSATYQVVPPFYSEWNFADPHFAGEWATDGTITTVLENGGSRSEDYSYSGESVQMSVSLRKNG